MASKFKTGHNQKNAGLARTVHDAGGMKSPKAINVVFLAAAIGWCGFSIAELVFSKVSVGSDETAEAAVVALASAAKAHDGPASERNLPPIASGPAVVTSGADPVRDATFDGPAESSPSPAAPGDPAATSEAKATVSATPPAPVEFEEADLLAAIQQGTIQAVLRGNGRERMTAQLRNNSPTPVRVSVSVGQVLEGGRNRVAVTRSATAELMPARTVELNLATAALLSSNVVGSTPYKFSYQNAGRVEGFLRWADDHGGITAPAIQAAVLALTENLPLRALAKFAQGTPGEGATDAFRAETADLLGALNALRDCGAKLETFAIAADPQLRIEAMIEPLSREAAKRYYGITENMEWEFWKRELLEGSPSTRHYALFGIARFYPEIALDMLPKWAREPQTHPVYRLAAVQALADTQRPEALTILRTLATELGPTTELGKAAAQSAKYLDRRLTEVAARTQVVSFRDKSHVTGL